MARLENQLQIPKKNGETQCSCPPFECLCSKNYSPGCRTFSMNREDSSSYTDHLMVSNLENVQNDCSVFQAIDKVLEDVACSYGHSTSYRLAAKVASDFDQAYYSSFADGYDAEVERMNQSFYPSCDIFHTPTSVKPSHHSDSHLLLPPPPLLHHNGGNDDVSTSFSDDCSIVQGKTTEIYPTFPEMEDVIHPSDILVLDQPLRKTGSWSENGQEPQQMGYAEGYHDQEETMKDDYVVTSLDDPDVSQRFFAAIDNLLLQDYGNGEAFPGTTTEGPRDSSKETSDHLQVPWDTNPIISSFFTQPQSRSNEMCYSSDPQEFTDPASKDLFPDHQTEDCKMLPTSYSTVFSISLQQAPPQKCGRGLEMTEPELVLPHRTNAHQVPF